MPDNETSESHPPTIDWLALIRKGRADELSEAATPIIGFRPPPDAFLAECRAAMKQGALLKCQDCTSLNMGWSQESWDCWLRNRAEPFRPPVRGSYTPQYVTCLLHLGFTYIYETPEQLARLRVKEPDQEPKPARSKIGKTARRIRPVDRVAGRVTGFPAQPENSDNAP